MNYEGTRTNTNPNGTEADAAGTSGNARVLRKQCKCGMIQELELELIQTQMAQKPMLRAEVGMRVRCANKASAE